MTILGMLIRLSVILNRAVDGTKANTESIAKLIEEDKRLDGRITSLDKEVQERDQKIYIKLTKIETEAVFIRDTLKEMKETLTNG